MKKILIGSCGGLTGHFLTKHFLESPYEVEIFGADADVPLATGKLMKKVFACPPATQEELFTKEIIKILNENKIEYYFPTHSKETKCISKYEEYIRTHTATKFVISPYHTFIALDDKKKANANLQKAGIAVPELFTKDEGINECRQGRKVFAKPSIGSGSHNSFAVTSGEQLKLIEQLYPNTIFMQFIKGTEYTVDILFDSYGNLICYNQRIRAKQAGGATVYTYNDYAVDVKDEILKISSSFKMKGVVNFQFILCDGIPFFTDINLRYASGGLPLSVFSGMALSKYLPEILDGKDFRFENPVKIDHRRIAMYRNYEETYGLLP